jgi:uncharacterized protein YicC (UPF0701 family)
MSRSTDPRTAESKAGARTGGLALGVLAAALLTSGCGEERLTKGAYEQQVQSEYATVQAAFEATRDTSGRRLAARLAAAREALRETAEALEAAEPPKQVQEENEELVEGMRDYAEQLEPLVEAARSGRQGVIDRFNSKLRSNEAVKRMAEAAEEMKFKGYDLGAVAEE